MNRISGKPLKTRDSGILDVAGIPCLILGLCQGSMGAAVTNGHSGHESGLSVAVLTPKTVKNNGKAIMSGGCFFFNKWEGYTPFEWLSLQLQQMRKRQVFQICAASDLIKFAR